MNALSPAKEQEPSLFTSEFAFVSEVITLSDPRKLSGEVYIDYGDPRSPRFLCDVPDAQAFNDVAERYFDLVDILMGDMVVRIRSADAPFRITLRMDLTEASSHRRLQAIGQLSDLLKAKEVAPERIEAFLSAA